MVLSIIIHLEYKLKFNKNKNVYKNKGYDSIENKKEILSRNIHKRDSQRTGLHLERKLLPNGFTDFAFVRFIAEFL